MFGWRCESEKRAKISFFQLFLWLLPPTRESNLNCKNIIFYGGFYALFIFFSLGKLSLLKITCYVHPHLRQASRAEICEKSLRAKLPAWQSEKNVNSRGCRICERHIFHSKNFFATSLVMNTAKVNCQRNRLLLLCSRSNLP